MDDFGTWYEDYYKETEAEKQKYCKHVWKPIPLIITTVYDCTKCGAKKEECE
jgi:hypothetical protein